MKNKRGSHVGIILSFTLFIGFLIFSYVLIGPTLRMNPELKESLTILKKEIIQELSEEIIFIWVYSESSLCSQIDLPDNSFENIQVFVINGTGEEVPSYFDTSKIYLQNLNGFTKIHISNSSFENESTSSLSGCQQVEIKSSLHEERIAEKRIIEMIGRIDNDYTNFREEFGFYGDLNILFKYSNGTQIGTKNVETNTNIYSESIFINYLSLKAEEKTGELIIRLW